MAISIRGLVLESGPNRLGQIIKIRSLDRLAFGVSEERFSCAPGDYMQVDVRDLLPTCRFVILEHRDAVRRQ